MNHQRKLEYKIVELLSPIDPKVIQLDEVISYIDKRPLNIEGVIYEAERCKVLSQLYFNIEYIESKLNVKCPFLAGCKKRIIETSPMIINRDQYISLLLETINNITRIENNVLFAKGTMLLSLYLIHSESLRQMNDIDVIFPEPSSVFKFLTLMSERDYYINNAKIYTKPVTFSKDAIARITSDHINSMHINIFHQVKKKIDVKCGYYLYLPSRILYARKRKDRIDKVEYWTVSIEHALYILIDHMVNHGYVQLSWVNDVYLLTTKTSLDWDYLFVLLSQKRDLLMFYSLLEYTEKIYKNEHIIDSLIQNYPKLFSRYKKSKTFQLLLKYTPPSHDFQLNDDDKYISAFEKFLIDVERVKTHVRHRLSFYILCCFLLLKFIRGFTPKWLTNIQKKIRNSIIIPLKIKYGYSVELPPVYKIEAQRKWLPSKENKKIIVTWQRKRGFRLSCSIVDFEQDG